MEIFDCSKSLLENLNYISGILIGILGIFGIWQLILTRRSLLVAQESLIQAKDEFKILSQRNAAHEAAKLCEKFVSDIIKKVNDFENTHNITGYPKIVGEIKHFNLLEKIIVSNKEESEKTWNEIFQPNAEFFLNILNEMETFALYFTKQIADENIAYQTVGKTFIDYVESYHIFIVIMNTQQNGTAYRNIRKLYKNWKNKSSNQDLKKTFEHFAEKIKQEKSKA